ncbi:uncharacterized membrane protein YhaH (DUF805 family) [Cryobacterium sp. MP_M5]|uniref:DUF805 domain-containing protein n=1 Tax=unclassified Cryobacterium TaxID=2649013 RepID=UPI0018C9BA6A|nr:MULTISPECIES: DUF805 domain-containing protein [unclassified Cryobacterium]MBG6057285.1 uncharacterized membrane protein YhaH (DUF805 family) [Cryobacterium sp. MP_M3]MEC5175484.1 uncharacterized membrane protein YhaH (DUF805 family) [Cryobacterium sp. MP_M5]
MSFPAAIQIVVRKYAEFTGTAGRAEFWWWILFTTLVTAVLGALSNLTENPATALSGAWNLVVLLPTLAVQIRRLRDAGYRWGNIFWLALPGAGLIVLAVLLAQPSRPSTAPRVLDANAPEPARA